jgi:hypothetical protein
MLTPPAHEGGVAHQFAVQLRVGADALDHQFVEGLAHARHAPHPASSP